MQYEIGKLSAALKEHGVAQEAFSRAVQLAPGNAGAWRRLGDELAVAGRQAEAREAYSRQFALAMQDLKSLEGAMLAGPDPALAALTDILARTPTNVTIALTFAEIEMRLHRYQDAETRLAEVLGLAPASPSRVISSRWALHKQTKVKEALHHLEILLREDNGNVACLNLKALSLVHIGEYTRAIATYEHLIRGRRRRCRVLGGLRPRT
ncbi:MAG: tetratricopeptide repeat protein [Rhizomicrobium sp.]